MRSLITTISSAALLSACSAISPNNDRPIETPARITSKIEHGKVKELRGQSSSSRDASLVAIVGSANAPVIASALENLFTRTPLGEALGMTQTLTIFAYVLVTNDGRTVTLLHEYPNFTVGDCMKLFELPGARDYPRIAYGSGCTGK